MVIGYWLLVVRRTLRSPLIAGSWFLSKVIGYRGMDDGGQPTKYREDFKRKKKIEERKSNIEYGIINTEATGNMAIGCLTQHQATTFRFPRNHVYCFQLSTNPYFLFSNPPMQPKLYAVYCQLLTISSYFLTRHSSPQFPNSYFLIPKKSEFF